MNIENIKQNIEKMRSKINELEQMIDDYGVCKSETSKKMIERAINVYAADIEPKSPQKNVQQQ